MDVDLVFLAMGFLGAGRTPMLAQLGVAIPNAGRWRRTPTRSTSIPGIFAAGDTARGRWTVVSRAMARRAAGGPGYGRVSHGVDDAAVVGGPGSGRQGLGLEATNTGPDAHLPVMDGRA